MPLPVLLDAPDLLVRMRLNASVWRRLTMDQKYARALRVTNDAALATRAVTYIDTYVRVYG